MSRFYSPDPYDRFVDYCDENGLDHESEDFYAWKEEEYDRAVDAAEQRAFDAMRDQ